MAQPFYAVRVVIRHKDNTTSTRDYVRGDSQHMGRDTFGQWALGNMLALVSDGDDVLRWSVTAIDFATVQDNRKYHHTTH